MRRDRLESLQQLLRSQQQAFNQEQLGRTLPVLIEGEGRTMGQLVGRSPFLQPVHFDAPVHRIGQLRPVEIIKFYCRNSVDERMLRLRQKRGELDASQDGDAPSADDVGAGAGDTAFAKADLDVLFGVTE